MLRSHTRVLPTITLLAAAAGLSTGISSAAAQAVWRQNIPDTFQHQRWGVRAAQNITECDANGDAVVPAATVAVPGAADPRGDGSWECSGYFPAAGGQPEQAFFYGMCFQASNVNQFYHFRQRGFKTFGGAGAGTNPANVDPLHDEVKTFETQYNAARKALSDVYTNGANPLAVRLEAFKKDNTPNLINTVLNGRGAGPNQGLNGLTAQNFKQVGNQVKYIGADGNEKFLGKGTLAGHIPALFRAGDLGNLRLAYPHDGTDLTGTSQEGLWWAGTNVDGGNFHNVTIAGFDPAGAGGNGTIYFADPDSNPTATVPNRGNSNIDSGWVTRTGTPPTLDRWKNPVAAIAQAGDTKPERFAAGAAIPVPAAFVGAPAAADQSRLYYTGTLAGTKKEFAITDAASDRYDGVQIRYLETLETIKAVAKPGGGPGAGAAKGLSITTGAADAENRINDFWVFPASADQAITSAIIPDAGEAALWSVSLLTTPFTDPWGNDRLFGGVHVSTLTGSLGTLMGGDMLDLDYETISTFDLTSWDFVYNDKFDASLASLGVQSYGGYGGYSLSTQQVPSPGALGLISLGLLTASRRPRRTS